MQEQKEEKKTVRTAKRLLTNLVCDYLMDLDKEVIDSFFDDKIRSRILQSKDTSDKLKEWVILNNPDFYSLQKDILSYVLGELVDWSLIASRLEKRD